MARLDRILEQPEGRGYQVLSFCRGDQLWEPEVSGDYATDCRTGRFYAQELAAYIGSSDSPAMLGYVVEAMAARTHSGVEVGFFHEIATAFQRSLPCVRATPGL